MDWALASPGAGAVLTRARFGAGFQVPATGAVGCGRLDLTDSRGCSPLPSSSRQRGRDGATATTGRRATSEVSCAFVSLRCSSCTAAKICEKIGYFTNCKIRRTKQNLIIKLITDENRETDLLNLICPSLARHYLNDLIRFNRFVSQFHPKVIK